MSKDQLIIKTLASLCDSMKRLERAIQSDNIDDRSYYIEEAAKRREAAEKIILEKLP